ncbi:MAG: hypothetical protein WAV05_11205, partial [Anaerolineales bacterium]
LTELAVINALCKTNSWLKNIDQNVGVNIEGTYSLAAIGSWYAGLTWAERIVYGNPSSVSPVIKLYGASTNAKSVRFDDVSVKRVTDPPATGVHIVSSLNGVTRAWENIEDGFNPNDIASWEIRPAEEISDTLANIPLRPGDLVISTSDDGEEFTDNGDGTLTGDDGGSGTIDYLTGEWSITYGSNPGTGHSITADYDYYPGLPIMGIVTFYTDAGSSQFLVFNTRRVNKYDPLTGKLEDIVGSDIFTGVDSDFFWFENWKDRLFITNNVDRVKIYDGTTFSDLDMDYDGDSNNDVDTCLLIFSYKGHLVLLRTTEKGYHAPHTARWSVANSYTNWKESEGGGYVNCPSLDWIMGGDFIGDDLIATMERSIWALKYTGDVNLPFKWENVKSTEGNYSTHSLAAFSDELIFLGPVNLVATDGLDVYGIDEKIPDFTLNFNQEGFKYCYGCVIEELRQYILSYPSMDAEISDSLLMMNYEEQTWADFKLPMHCFGYFNQMEDLTWDDVELTWDEIEWSWDEKELQAGYPITLGGSHDGVIYKMNDGGSDKGDPIDLDIESGHWNPYVDKGRKARLGWIDFLVERDPNISVDIEFYLDH